MSDKAKTPEFKAILTEARIYVLMVPKDETDRNPVSIEFQRGKPKKVSAKVKAMLEEQAIDNVAVGSGRRTRTEKRCKFEFVEIGSDEDKAAEEAASAPRRRRAPPAETE